jgi:hypothetical protein
MISKIGPIADDLDLFDVARNINLSALHAIKIRRKHFHSNRFFGPSHEDSVIRLKLSIAETSAFLLVASYELTTSRMAVSSSLISCSPPYGEGVVGLGHLITQKA